MSCQSNDFDIFEDDFECGNKKDFIVDQNANNRMLSEINTAGYRDGLQKFMEDETHLQRGFDFGFKILSRLAFLVGHVKSTVAFAHFSKNDSSLLAKINDKLEKIENYNYELMLDWDLTKSNDANVEKLEKDIRDLEKKLENFREHFKNLRLTQTKGLFETNCSAVDTNDLEISDEMKVKEDQFQIDSDEIEKDFKSIQTLSDLIDNLCF